MCILLFKISFSCFCQKIESSGIFLKAFCSQQVRVMTGSGGRPRPGWHVLCLHPVASCAITSIWAETLLIHWLFTNNRPLPKDHTGLESKSIFKCFVLFLSFRYSLDLSLQPLLHNQTVNMTCVFYIYMHSSYFLKVSAFFGPYVKLCVCVVLKLQQVVQLVKLLSGND